MSVHSTGPGNPHEGREASAHPANVNRPEQANHPDDVWDETPLSGGTMHDG